MKNKVKLLLVLFSLAFVSFSCSMFQPDEELGNLTFEIDENIAKSARSAVSYDESEAVTIRASISGGGYSSEQEATATLGTLVGQKVTFESVPSNRDVTVNVRIYCNGDLLYEGSAQTTLSGGSKTVSVVMEKLLNTKTLVWNKESSTYTFYSLNRASGTLETAFASVSGVYETPSFAFDSDGYVYMLKSSGGSYSIVSDKYSEQGISAIENASGITIDTKNNVLYVYYGMQGLFDVYKFEKFINIEGELSYTTVPSINFSSMLDDTGNFYHYNPLFVVHDGIAYGIGGESTYLSYRKLYKVDLSEASPQAHEINFDYESLGLSGEATITDMIYQDGALYMLVNESANIEYINSGAITSRGAVIKYNTATGTFSVLGYAGGTLSNTDITSSGMYISNSDSGGIFYKDNQLTTPVVFKGNEHLSTDTLCNSRFPSFRMPSPLASDVSSSAFYGPKKFVAVKPKKLVIADDGIAVYTNSDGGFRYKNVNRVVYVDLEKFAISGTENVNAKFDSDESGTKGLFAFSSIGTNFDAGGYTQSPNTVSSAVVYIYNGYGNDPETSNFSGSRYFVMPCADASE